MLFVITVEEAELLLAVGRVISGVHIQDDDLAGTGVGLEVQVQQPVGEPAQVFRCYPIFEAGQSGLGGQFAGAFRSFAGHDLYCRVFGQPGGVIVVLVTLGDGKEALTHQRKKIVLNLA